MAIFRYVQTAFWQDSFVLELTPEEKYFYLYLMTNQRTSQCGIFEISKRIMEIETGYSRETIDKLLKRFIGYGKILYCEETREIIILNWFKYNFINSKNTILCINKELKAVKNMEFIKRLYDLCIHMRIKVEDIFRNVVLDEENNKEENNKIEAYLQVGEHNSVLQEEVYGNYSVDNSSTMPCSEESDNNIDIAYDNASKEVNILSYSYDAKSYENKVGLQGAIKPLGEKEKESKKEKELKKESLNRVLLEFNKNMRQATVNDLDKLCFFKKDFEEEVIIHAIKEANKRKASHPAYIWAILKTWKETGLFTIEKLKAQKGSKKDENTNSHPRCNAAAYRYVEV